MKRAIYSILISVLIGCTTGMSSIKDVSSDSRVRRHIGREFILKEDLYLYIRKTIELEYPLLGPSRAGPLGLGQPRLPAPVTNSRIGYEDAQIKIIGVLTKGTVVRIARIVHLSEPTDQHFFIKLNTSDLKYPHAEYHIPAVKGLDGAAEKNFAQQPWFFDYYTHERK